MLANPGFEDVDDDSSWIVYTPTGTSYTVVDDSVGAYSGRYYAKMTSLAGAQMLVYQAAYPVEPGNAYKFSAFIKDVSPTALTGSYAALKISAKSSGGSTFKYWQEYQEGVTTEWKEFSSIKTMPEGTAFIQVVFVIRGVADVDTASYGIDDANLELVYEKPELTKELNWFENPGFEEGDADSNNIPDGWLGGGQTKGSMEVVKDKYSALRGDYYAKVTSIEGNYYLLYYKTIRANPGEVWKLSAFIKDVSSSDPGGNFCALKISAKNSASSTMSAVEVFQEVTTYWKDYSVEYTMPENTYYLQAVLVVNGDDYTAEASYAFDDVRLELVQELTVNTGFEDGDTDANGAPDGWIIYGKAAQTSFTLHQDSLAHYGDYWVEASVDSGNTYYLIYLDPIPTAPGEIWSWRAFIKNTSPDSLGDYVFLKMAAKNSSLSTFMNYEVRQEGVTRDWKDYANTQVMPVGTAYMQPSLVVKKSASDSLDTDVVVSYGFDDIRLINLGFSDITGPDAPGSVTATSGTDDYTNEITWTDVASEIGETYSLYASTEPFTNVSDAGVELLMDGIAKGTQNYVHYLLNPYENKDVTYYYAVTATDTVDNVSLPGFSSEFTNTAKGVATISTIVPINFTADGVISEWDTLGVQPFVLTPRTAHVASGVFTDDADLTLTGYLGVDDNNLYVSIKVIDDVYCYSSTASYYKNDVVFLYLGLYDQVRKHMSTERGEEPDYRFNLLSDYLRNVNAGTGADTLYTNGDENYCFLNSGEGYYIIEAKIPFDDILLGLQATDTRFQPALGMKIAIDIEVCDSDETGSRQGLLSYSQENDDTSWKGPQYWSYTWIDDSTFVVGIDKDKSNLIYTYELNQNYPNPFNPTTHISYSLAKPSDVNIVVFDLLGKEVARLVQERQDVGKHNVIFNARNLSTGLYFYQIKAGDFTKTKKMMIIK